jgi:hypothetical protein
MLAAIADSPPTPRLSPLLRRLAKEPRGLREKTELLARAAARQPDPLLIPHLVSLLSAREGREAVRTALVALGNPALDEVRSTLIDPTCARRLRLHMPKTVARFANKKAAEYLLDEIETEQDGLVRYKAIRALRPLVTDHRIFVDRLRTERLCEVDLEKHFRMLALRAVLDLPGAPNRLATQALLLELLREKAAHSLERSFQLLQIAHPRQGVHHAYLACRSADPYARANAAELLDALLPRGDQQRLRALFRVATDDLSFEERVERGRALVSLTARTHDEAVAVLVRGRDAMLAALGRRLQPQHEAHASAEVLPLLRAR